MAADVTKTGNGEPEAENSNERPSVFSNVVKMVEDELSLDRREDRRSLRHL